MSQDLASATSAPASSAWSVAPSSATLTFNKDADDGFPMGGAIMLVMLMAVAVWAWWYGRVRGGRVGDLPVLPAAWRRQAGIANDLRIVDSLQASGGVRLMVVEWAGGRRVLVATHGASAPVTLDVLNGAAGRSEAEK